MGNSIVGGGSEKTSKGPGVREAQVRTPGNQDRDKGQSIVGGSGNTHSGAETTKTMGQWTESQVRAPMKGPAPKGRKF